MNREKQGETFVIKEAPPQEKPIEFTTFLLGLASTALIHLGAAPNPETQKPELDLLLARQSLELLGLLREKTRGNLTSEEERLFDQILAELRLKYVEAAGK